MNEENTAIKGAERLLDTLAGKTPLQSSAPYDEDSEVVSVLTHLEYANLANFDLDEASNHQWLRARVRYLAALWPEATQQELVQRIHGLLNNKHFDIDDLRIILQGRRLSDPSERTNEISITVIQSIGKCLREGLSMRATAREARVSYDTVEAIENFLGIRSANRSKQIDIAVEAVREGTSVRALARSINVSPSRAHRLLAQGREILIELGEITSTGKGATA